MKDPRTQHFNEYLKIEENEQGYTTEKRVSPAECFKSVTDYNKELFPVYDEGTGAGIRIYRLPTSPEFVETAMWNAKDVRHTNDVSAANRQCAALGSKRCHITCADCEEHPWCELKYKIKSGIRCPHKCHYCGRRENRITAMVTRNNDEDYDSAIKTTDYDAGIDIEGEYINDEKNEILNAAADKIPADLRPIWDALLEAEKLKDQVKTLDAYVSKLRKRVERLAKLVEQPHKGDTAKTIADREKTLAEYVTELAECDAWLREKREYVTQRAIAARLGLNEDKLFYRQKKLRSFFLLNDLLKTYFDFLK